MTKRVWVAAGVALALAACEDQTSRSARHLSPIPPSTMALMAQKGVSKEDPILIRAYKKESEMEVWKRGADGHYAHLKTYPICRWSGQLGPKVKQGDRQAPEGFYTVTPAQMNPNSAYYLSFDTGYPNAFDRAHGRTGAHLMVHGTCSSAGCYAMTDEAISEVYALAREAFNGGQRAFQFQAYPFRMTPENLARHRADPNIAFWRNLKEGNDYFEVTGNEPKVAACGKRYVFGGQDVAQGSCSPQVDPAVAEKGEQDERKVAELVGKGVPAIRVVYQDGGGHAAFHETTVATGGGDSSGNYALFDFRARPNLGQVSRPEALAAGPREIPVETAAKPETKVDKSSRALAYTPGKRPAQQGANPEGASLAASPPVADSKSLYERTFGKLFGSSEKEADTAKAEPATTPASTPLPPRRGAAAAETKPQAAKALSEPRV